MQLPFPLELPPLLGIQNWLTVLEKP
jgi:hypothetical protein